MVFTKGGSRRGSGRVGRLPGHAPSKTAVPATRAGRVAKAQIVAEGASEAAVRLLAKQFRDKELSARDRREAAIAVLKVANLPVMTAEDLDKFAGMTRGSLEREIGFIITRAKSQPDGTGVERPTVSTPERPVDAINLLLERISKPKADEQDRVPQPDEISQDRQVPQVVEKEKIDSGGKSVSEVDRGNNRGHLVGDGDAPVPPDRNPE